ncbi:MAG: hypothetical protein H6588_08510 [Flavobacteriales bacterium]|nr:hypothetical protein [Flavobacteriales bacterium]
MNERGVYVNFHKFSSIEEATELSETLKQESISSVVENASPPVDITFSGNVLQNEFIVKIMSSDFEKANLVLEEYAKNNIENISKEHYLYEFSNEELLEILEKPDEWCKEDYFLAQKILKDKGQEVAGVKLEELKKKRIDDLRKPEKAEEGWIIAGYFMALFGGVLGVFIGWFHWTFKKTDPLGLRVYVYDEKTRKKGKNLFLFGITLQIIWILIWVKYGFY